MPPALAIGTFRPQIMANASALPMAAKLGYAVRKAANAPEAGMKVRKAARQQIGTAGTTVLADGIRSW